MDRLNFRVPEFVRIAWANAEAEKVWAPLIQKCSNFFIYLERFNRTSIVSVGPEELIGHSYIPLYQTNINNVYQAGSSTFNPNQPWHYRCASGPKAQELAKAYIKQDWIAVGRILGYPDCCIEFFMRYWVEEQWFDTTYCMGRNNLLSPVNNILLRWIGIRLVSHLPCSFNCFETMRIGENNTTLARELGFHQEVDYIREMLSWPVEWTSLHGIAIITTPVFKIITATDALPTKAVVRLEGVEYPKEAGSGLVFPFIQPLAEDEYLSNGFSNKEAMDEAHKKIIDAITYLKPKSILDLGCGNGLLLKKMAAIFKAYTLGVDHNELRHPNVCMNIFDFEFQQDFDLVLIAEQRLQEDPPGWSALSVRIADHAKHRCIYNYNTGNIEILTYDLSANI